MLQNIRMSYELRDRARNCATDVHLPLSEWCRRAVKQFGGSGDGVAMPEKWQYTTRSDSVPVAVELPANAQDMDSGQVRAAIAEAVLYCEARQPEPFEPHTNFYRVVGAE